MITLTQLSIALPEDKIPTKQLARDMIATFLTQEWPQQDPESLKVTYSTSFTNPSCVVERPQLADGIHAEPCKLFIKFQHPGSGSIPAFAHLMPTKEEEALFTHDFGRSGLGARVYGLFRTTDGTIGRIDEFLDARNLKPEDVEREAIRADVARGLATFHTLQTSLPKRPVALYYEAVGNGLRKYHKSDRLKASARDGGLNIDCLVDYDFASPCEEVVARLERVKAKTGWCIHDVQFMNVLVRNRPGQNESSIRLIDFELVFQNYRAFDIGAHFMQKMFQWFDPVDKIAPCRPYTEAEKRHFCEVYAREWNARTGDHDSAQQVYLEAELAYMLAIAFDTHNMLWYLSDGNDMKEALAMVPGMNKLLDEFKSQSAKLGFDGSTASLKKSG